MHWAKVVILNHHSVGDEMKLTQYQQQVNPNNISGRVQAAGSIQSYGSDQSALLGLGRTVGAINEQVQGIMVDDDKRTLMEAMNAYNKAQQDLLYNDSDGLMRTNLEGAAGISNSYIEQERKLRQNILQNTKFNTEQYRNVFNDMANKSAEQSFRLVNNHQYEQGEKVKDVSLDNNLTNYINFAQENYGSTELIGAQQQLGALMIANRYEGYGNEFIQSQVRKYGSKLGDAVITQAITNEDYEAAEKLMNEFSPYLTADQRSAFGKVIYEKQKADYQYALVDQLISQYGYDNEEAVANALQSAPSFTMSFDDLYSSMTQQESGGNTSAVNARTGAYGSLQILPSNWAQWSEEALGYVGDMQNVDDYNKVASYKLKQYYDAYGPEGAMVAWYAGPTNGQRWKDGKPTAIDANGNEYSWDAKQGNGDEPSIREYVQGVSQRRVMSREQQEEVLQQYKIRSKQHKDTIKKQQDEYYKSAIDQIYQMQQQGVPYEAALSWAKKTAGSNYDAMKKLTQAVNDWYGSSGKGGVIPDYIANNLKRDLMSGEVQSLEQFMNTVNQLTSDPIERQKWQDEYMKAAKKQGKYKFEWSGVVDRWKSSRKIKDNVFANGAKLVAEGWVDDYMTENNGMPPTEAQVYQVMDEAVSKGFGAPEMSLTDKWFSDNPNTGQYSQAEIQQVTGAYHIEDVGDTDGSGRALIRVWYTGEGGQYHVVPRDEFYARVDQQLKILRGK